MRPILVALPLALLACAPPPPEGAGATSTLVRVVTWNVHDLFDAEDRLVSPGDLDAVPSPPEVEAKLGRVAAVLARLDADVVLLQEVENLAVLGALATRAGYPEARLVEGNDPRGIDVAALSRLTVLDYVSHRGERDQDGALLWPRDCVEVHLSVGGARLVLVASHLSSALSDDGTRRARQAARMRAHADGLVARGAGRVIAGGDLNDVLSSPSLAPLVGDGSWVSPAARLPKDLAWTWSGGAVAQVLDHLLLPRADEVTVLRAAVEGGSEVAAASDHRPVVLDLWVP